MLLSDIWSRSSFWVTVHASRVLMSAKQSIVYRGLAHLQTESKLLLLQMLASLARIYDPVWVILICGPKWRLKCPRNFRSSPYPAWSVLFTFSANSSNNIGWGGGGGWRLFGSFILDMRYAFFLFFFQSHCPEMCVWVCVRAQLQASVFDTLSPRCQKVGLGERESVCVCAREGACVRVCMCVCACAFKSLLKE